MICSLQNSSEIIAGRNTGGTTLGIVLRSFKSVLMNFQTFLNPTVGINFLLKSSEKLYIDLNFAQIWDQSYRQKVKPNQCFVNSGHLHHNIFNLYHTIE